MIRRRIVLAYWVCAFTLLAPGAVYAYIDPATTTYLIQIATALVVTIGVSLSVFLYKFRMISSKIKFGIYGIFYRVRSKEEMREGGKDNGKAQAADGYVSPPFIVKGSKAPPEIASFDEGLRGELEAGRDSVLPQGDAPAGETPAAYKGRMRLVLPAALAFSFTFVVIGCLELAIAYAPEIPFRLSAIVPAVLICFAGVFAALLIVIPLFRGKLFECVLSIGAAVLIAGYIQGTFLNWGIGALTGDAVVWGNLKPQFVASIVCWTGCIILVILLWRRARKAWRKVIIFAPALLILLQGVGFISVVSDASKDTTWGSGIFWQQADESLTVENINEAAPGKNAIVIILDRLDQDFIDEIHAETPDFFDPLDGFTEFDDYISAYGTTFPSEPNLLTGLGYQYDMPYTDYFNIAWKEAAFIRELKDRNFDIRIYSERGSPYDSIDQIEGIVSNTPKGQIDIKERVALVKLLKLAGYRYAPMPLKQYFWFYVTEFSSVMDITDETRPYVIDDFTYYKNLTEQGLKISDAMENSFYFLHLQGSHPPHNMNENVEWVEESDFNSQTRGAFQIVYEYLRQLKALGLYEDAAIVIMGDHGNYYGDELKAPARTALMVKPSGSADTPLGISHAPVSSAQLHATLMESLFGEAGDFGETFFDMREGDDVTRSYAISHWRYEITGDGRDFSNWKYKGLYPDTYK